MAVGGYLDRGFGLEGAARGALVLLLEGLNEELASQEALWATMDEQLDSMRERDYAPVTQEPVELDNFYLGHQPYLLDETAPLTKYPNVSVMAFTAGPAGADFGDHFTEYSDRIYVETMVKASPAEGAEVCDKRIWRAADAVHNVISRDSSLRGAVAGLSEDPTCIVSEVLTRAANAAEGHGEEWFWQAARIEYVVSKISPFQG